MNDIILILNKSKLKNKSNL